MKTRTHAIFVLMVTLLFACQPKSIISLKTGESLPDGHIAYLNYYLPRTELKIKIPLEKKVFVKGLITDLDAADRARILKKLEELYGWKEVKVEKKYGIGSKIQFNPITKPDATKHYTLAYRNSKSLSQSSKVSLNKDGIISSGEFSQESKTFEFVSKGIELGASIASKIFFLGGVAMAGDFTPYGKQIEKLMEEYEGLVGAKNDLILKNANGVSKDAMDYRIKLIDKRMAEVKKIVLGYEKKSTVWLGLVYDPTNILKQDPNDHTKKVINTDQIQNITLFQLDEQNGISIPNTSSNWTDLLDSSIGTTTSATKDLSLRVVRISPEINDNLGLSESELEYGEYGFLRYNIPAKYTLQLLWDGKPLKSYVDAEDKKGTDLYTIYFPQMGSVGVLPRDFKESSVVYYEDIGALKSISFSKASTLNADAVQLAYAAADSIVSYRDVRRAYLEGKNASTEENETEETEETVIRIIFDGTPPAGG